MYKIIIIFKFIIILFFFTNNSLAAPKHGTGELKLSYGTTNYFIRYIRGEQFKYPAVFYVTVDGSSATFWYCSEMTNCRSGSHVKNLETCSRNTGMECNIFARRRTIKWQNDINPGKGKISRINSKWSDEEIRAHLRKLGFYD